jgi:coatomer protein complex subunit alpha (xenin)
LHARIAFERGVQIREHIVTCREYILGLSLEIERRRIQAEEPTNIKRQLELAAYFTHCGIRPADLTLALRLAMSLFTKQRNTATAAVFAQRLLDLPGQADQRVAQSVRFYFGLLARHSSFRQAQQVLTAANRNPKDAIEIDYDRKERPAGRRHG